MGIHRTYPYPAYGGLAPVPGGHREQRDDIANPTQVYLRLSKTTLVCDTAVYTLFSVFERRVFAFGPVPGYMGYI